MTEAEEKAFNAGYEFALAEMEPVLLTLLSATIGPASAKEMIQKLQQMRADAKNQPEAGQTAVNPEPEAVA